MKDFAKLIAAAVVGALAMGVLTAAPKDSCETNNLRLERIELMVEGLVQKPPSSGSDFGSNSLEKELSEMNEHLQNMEYNLSSIDNRLMLNEQLRQMRK